MRTAIILRVKKVICSGKHRHKGECFLMHSAKPVRRAQCEFGFHGGEIPDETLSV
jgi:hypothetical protein